MTVRELLSKIKMLLEVKFSYFDYMQCKDVEISQEQAMDMDIFYIYIQNGFLYIAVKHKKGD